MMYRALEQIGFSPDPASHAHKVAMIGDRYDRGFATTCRAESETPTNVFHPLARLDTDSQIGLWTNVSTVNVLTGLQSTMDEYFRVKLWG